MKKRIHSIDIVRGIIMVIMALDHVRDFLHTPGSPPLNMQTTTGILFFTRWITHFCAPTFVFLGGVSVYLAGLRRTKKELTSFLLKRGAWLILTDLLVISFIFTFDPGYHTMVLEVLCVTGFGMIFLAFLIHAPLRVTAIVALIILFGHNIFDYVHLQETTPGKGVISFFLTAFAMVIPLGENRMIIEIYAILPWSAILLLGYVFGRMYHPEYDAEKRRRFLLLTGLCVTFLFIILRVINQYGDQSHWSTQRNAAHTFLSFLNVSKQPPSLLFVSAILGPILILLSFAERFKGRVWDICRVYGNVPYFYFILHLILIRIINILLILAQGITITFDGYPLVWQAKDFGGVPLWAVYVYWILVVVLLYYPCKWYGNYKRSHSHWWLSYI